MAGAAVGVGVAERADAAAARDGGPPFRALLDDADDLEAFPGLDDAADRDDDSDADFFCDLRAPLAFAGLASGAAGCASPPNAGAAAGAAGAAAFFACPGATCSAAA